MSVIGFSSAEVAALQSESLDTGRDEEELTAFSSLHIVTPGEVITTDTTFLRHDLVLLCHGNVSYDFYRGHGTHVGPSNELMASVAGVVERVNKLVTVRPLHSRHALLLDSVPSLIRQKICRRNRRYCNWASDRGALHSFF